MNRLILGASALMCCFALSAAFVSADDNEGAEKAHPKADADQVAPGDPVSEEQEATEEPEGEHPKKDEHEKQEADHSHGTASHKGDEDHGGNHGAAHGPGHVDEATALSPLAFDPDLAIVTAIVFLVLLVFLGKFAWGPIMAGLDAREKAVAEQIDQAYQSNAKAEETLKQYQEKLAASMDEAKQLVADARRDAETSRDKIVSDAENAAAKERDRAIEDIRLAKETALQELAEQSVNQAVDLAGGIMRREVKADDHSQLIRDALDQFPSKN